MTDAMAPQDEGVPPLPDAVIAQLPPAPEPAVSEKMKKFGRQALRWIIKSNTSESQLVQDIRQYDNKEGLDRLGRKEDQVIAWTGLSAKDLEDDDALEAWVWSQNMTFLEANLAMLKDIDLEIEQRGKRIPRFVRRALKAATSDAKATLQPLQQDDPPWARAIYSATYGSNGIWYMYLIFAGKEKAALPRPFAMHCRTFSVLIGHFLSGTISFRQFIDTWAKRFGAALPAMIAYQISQIHDRGLPEEEWISGTPTYKWAVFGATIGASALYFMGPDMINWVESKFAFRSARKWGDKDRSDTEAQETPSLIIKLQRTVKRCNMLLAAEEAFKKEYRFGSATSDQLARHHGSVVALRNLCSKLVSELGRTPLEEHPDNEKAAKGALITLASFFTAYKLVAAKDTEIKLAEMGAWALVYEYLLLKDLWLMPAPKMVFDMIFLGSAMIVEGAIVDPQLLFSPDKSEYFNNRPDEAIGMAFVGAYLNLSIFPNTIKPLTNYFARREVAKALQEVQEELDRTHEAYAAWGETEQEGIELEPVPSAGGAEPADRTIAGIYLSDGWGQIMTEDDDKIDEHEFSKTFNKVFDALAADPSSRVMEEKELRMEAMVLMTMVEGFGKDDEELEASMPGILEQVMSIPLEELMEEVKLS